MMFISSLASLILEYTEEPDLDLGILAFVFLGAALIILATIGMPRLYIKYNR